MVDLNLDIKDHDLEYKIIWIYLVSSIISWQCYQQQRTKIYKQEAG